MSVWLFVDGPETVAITSRGITNREKPILFASHELDEDGEVVWQFHFDEEQFDFSSAMLVRLDTIIKIDSTVDQLSHLPIGYSAKRNEIGGEWTIHPINSSE